MREIREELGLNLDVTGFTLASVDYLNETSDRTEALQFLFAGPDLTEDQVANISLPENELKRYAFLLPPEAAQRLGSVVGPRLLRAIDAIGRCASVYWEEVYTK